MGNKKNSFKKCYAVSEIVGGIILLLIAVIAFSVMYPYLFPPGPDVETPVKIKGYVSDEGSIILSHEGGDTVSNYRIVINYPGGETIGTKTISNDNWKIGDKRYPLEQMDIYDFRLVNETVSAEISVYTNEAGSSEQIFHGILAGKMEGTTSTSESLEDPMLITSLKTNSCEEDLICFNDTIDIPSDVKTFIYNWLEVNNPICYVIYPFDLDDNSVVKDYSCNNTESDYNFNGEIIGANWSENGVAGGCYQFDGDDYIDLPYCCDKNGFIDEITFETWINTNTQNGVISSFKNENYWELSVNEGFVKWFTNGSDGSNEISSVSTVSDGNWHHLAVTYDNSNGLCSIYVDGTPEKQLSCHDATTSLGDGSKPNITIGTGCGRINKGSWQTLTYDDFEGGWGNYIDGGRDCERSVWYKHQGSYSASVWDNEGIDSSFYSSNGIDVASPTYTSILVDFWWMWRDSWSWWSDGWSTGEDWWVQYWDGNQWNTILDRNYDSGFDEDVWYHEIIYINETDYNFPTDMKIRFRCDAGANIDEVYFDQIYINATSGTTFYENFTGKIDEIRIYNRTLSPEQIHQNYLLTKDGFSDRSVVVSEETQIGDIWSCNVTPNNGIKDYNVTRSNSIQIINYSGGE